MMGEAVERAQRQQRSMDAYERILERRQNVCLCGGTLRTRQQSQ